MKKIQLLLITFLFMGMVTCQTQKMLVPTQARKVNHNEVQGYHKELSLTIAWLPYQDQKLVKTSDDSWKVVYSDSGQVGNIPVILIRYPDSQDSIWLDMNTPNEVLGSVLKHSLMTQEAISYPLEDYIKSASCQKCHPKDVEVDFER